MKFRNATALLLGLLLAEAVCACGGHPRQLPKPAVVVEQENVAPSTAMYVVNPGAQVEIILVPAATLQSMIDMPYPVVGIFHHHPGQPSTIFLAWDGGEKFPAVALTLLHEYEHLLETEFPKDAPKLRHLFLSLQARANGVDFSQMDLADELPPFQNPPAPDKK